jgi:hypothetical protein
LGAFPSGIDPSGYNEAMDVLRIALGTALTATLLYACGGASDKPAAALDAGGDAQAVDAGELDQGVRDAGELDAGRVDAHVDLADAGQDGGEPDAGRDYSGPCSFVPQSGCAAGEACRVGRAMDTRIESHCALGGTLGENEAWCPPRPAPSSLCTCNEYPPRREAACAPGFECRGRCRRLCVFGGPGDQCPAYMGTAMTCRQWDPGGQALGYCDPAP